ncbi:hypothetical protein I4U23_019612 [Adineta vaga]|nr:hypothetical protein I4U23_019612 [Adineta vaga]
MGPSPDSMSQKIAFIAVAFGTIALILVCVGVATPNWYLGYTPTSSTDYYKSTSANFFYSCSFGSDGTYYNCTRRENGLFYYPYSSNWGWATDFSYRMRNAGALCIVGIILLAAGVILTFIMALVYLPASVNLYHQCCSSLLVFLCLLVWLKVHAF